ncbi:MAG: hypothetical protein IH946_01655 [Bacteroidetes bacterium]|nr:hypothetical protein [Bacteroidota bacterium]
MTRHKINIDRPGISSTEIENLQNYEQVVSGAAQTGGSILSSFKFWGSALITVGVAATALVVIMNDPNPEMEQSMDTVFIPNQEVVEIDPFIEPPLKEVNIPFQTFLVNTDAGGEYEYKTGSSFNIPANAFVDAKGAPIEGTVDIQYREFHDPWEFFVSGIPMHYDSAGDYQLESAGMIEILASKDGEEVFLAPEKQIDVMMRTGHGGNDFNVYFLDEDEKNWVYEGQDELIVEESTNNNDQGLASESEITDSIDPTWFDIPRLKNVVIPQQADEQRYSFKIDYDKEAFSELAIYSDVEFEINERNRDFDAKYFDISWESAEVKRDENGYSLILGINDTSITFYVDPVFKGDNYDEAMNTYASKYQEYYDQFVTNTQQLDQGLRMSTRKDRQEQRDNGMSMTTQNVDMIAMMGNQQLDFESSVNQKAFRAFGISSMGIWNCDKPAGLPNGGSIIVDLVDHQGEPLEYSNLWLVDSKRNTVFKYYKGAAVKYNPRSKNLLWGVLANGQIAVFMPEDFKEMGKVKGRKTLVMHVGDVRHAADIHKMIRS